MKGGTRLAAAGFALVVGLVLLLTEIRPQLRDVAHALPDGRVLHLPTWLIGDCPYYRAAAGAMLHGRLDLRGDPLFLALRPEGQVALGARGEWYPKHPLLLPALALPFYAAAGDGGLLAFNLLALVALDVLVFLLAARISSPRSALLAALLTALTTLLRPAAYNFSPDVLSTLVVLGGVLALFGRRPAIAGALFGLSVCAKWTNLFLLVPALAWTGLALGRRPALRFAVAAAPPLVVLGLLDWHMFGTPLATPYDRVLAPGGLEPSHRLLFDQPFWSGLWTQISDPDLGLLRSAPQVVLALPGMVLLLRRARREAILCGALCAVQLAVFAPYRQWNASSYGHRFWMTVVALSALPLAALLERALPGQRQNEEIQSGNA